MQVSTSDNFQHAAAIGHCEQSQHSDIKTDQEVMHASPLTMATNGTSSPSVAGSEPSGGGSTADSNLPCDGQPPSQDLLHHPIAFLLRCPECPYETLSLERMRAHFPCSLRVAPTKFFVYRCDHCKSISTSRKLIEEHKTMHHAHPSEVTISEIADQIDPVVPLFSSSSDERAAPLPPLSASNSLMCPICRTPCRTTKDLAAHFESNHSKALLNPPNRIIPPFMGNAGLLGNATLPQQPLCFLCSAVFPDHDSLLAHLTRNHKDMMMAVLAVNDFNGSPVPKFPPFNNCSNENYEVGDMDGPVPMKDLPNLTAASVSPAAVAASSNTLGGPSASTPKPKLGSNLFLSSPFSAAGPIPSLAGLQSLNPQAAAALAASMASANQGADRQSILPRTQPLPLHNTIRKTKSDMKVINRFLAAKGDERDVCDMTVEELNVHLQDFIMNARKKDQNDYEPESLKAFIHSLERHLKGNDYPYSVLRDAAFSHTRAVLHNRLQNLRQSSRTALTTAGGANARGAPPGAVRQTYADLLKCGLLGHESPQAVLSTLFVAAKKFFGIKGPARHKMLTWGQFSVVETPLNGEVLQYRCESLGVRQHSRSAGMNFPVDVIQTFRIYENLRPVESRNFSDPFYLAIDPAWEHGGSWFRPTPLGLTYLQRIPRLLTSGIAQPAVANSSGLSGDDSGPSPGLVSSNGGGDGPPAMTPSTNPHDLSQASFDAAMPSMVAGSSAGDDTAELRLPNVGMEVHE